MLRPEMSLNDGWGEAEVKIFTANWVNLQKTIATSAAAYEGCCTLTTKLFVPVRIPPNVQIGEFFFTIGIIHRTGGCCFDNVLPFEPGGVTIHEDNVSTFTVALGEHGPTLAGQDAVVVRGRRVSLQGGAKRLLRQ